MADIIDEIGLDYINHVCDMHDGISAQKLVFEMLTHKNHLFSGE
jgi:hypothetical protein